MQPRTEHGEADLVRGFRSGDPEACRILFDACTGLLEAHLRRRLPAGLRRRVSIADVLQDAWMTAVEKRETFDGKDLGQFRRWLVGVLDRRALQAIERHAGTGKRNVAREVTRGRRPDTGEFLGRQASPSQVAMSAELGGLVREALQELTADHREVLRLVHEERLNLRQAAEQLERSHEATRKLHGRALYAFSEALRRRGGVGHG